MNKDKKKTITDPEIKSEEAEANTQPPAQESEASKPETAETPAPEVDTAKLLEFLKKAQDERDEYLSAAQHAQADLANYKRRNATVRSDALDDATRDAVTAILPVLDNLGRAIAAAKDMPEEDKLKAGVVMVEKQMREALEKLGMEQVDVQPGDIFDHNLHNAVMTVPADAEHPDNTICDSLQSGIKVRGKMIRYAMVRVYKEV